MEHKSSTSTKIIKTVDSEGNVTEQIITEGGQDSSISEDEFRNQFMASAPKTTRASVTSQRTVKMIDGQGNVTEKVLGEGDNFEFDTDEMKKHFGVSEHKSSTCRKIIKTVDSEGNVTEQIITEGYPELSDTEDEFRNQFMTSIPPTTRTSVISKRTVKVIDSEGNVTEKVLGEGDDFEFDTDELRKHFSTMEHKSSTSTKIIKTVDSEGNVTEQIITEGGQDSSISEDEFRNQFMASAPKTTRASVTSQRTVKMIDGQGNVTEKVLGEGDNFEFDTDEMKKHFGVSEHKSSTCRKIIKTVDSEGNVTEQIITEGDPELSATEDEFRNQFMSSVPQSTRTSVTSKRTVKKIDSEGNVTEEIISEGDLKYPDNEDQKIIKKSETTISAAVPQEVSTTTSGKTMITLPDTIIQGTDNMCSTTPREKITKLRHTNSGTLNLTLVGAKDLENADYIGKSDPYVAVQYGDKIFRSQTVSNDLNPVWNFSMTLEIIETDSGYIYIQVYDEDYNGDDEIGKTTIRVQDLIDSKNVEGKWFELNDCKSGEIQISSKYEPIMIEEILEQTEEEQSSVTGKLEFDLKSTQAMYDITETQEHHVKGKPSQDYSQNFDRIVKKSSKKIIRRMGSDGNMVEEVVEEGKHPENWETSTLNMSSGIQVVTGQSKKTSIKKTIDQFGNVISKDVQTSYDQDPSIDFDELYKSGYSAIPIKKTSVTKTKRIIRKMDEEGNVIEETYEGDDDNIIPDFGSNLPGSITRTSTQTSRKIIKRIDEDGNVTEEIITDSDVNPTVTSEDLKYQFYSPQNVHFDEFGGSSFPQTITSRKSVSSRKIIKTVDSDGNVIEQIVTEGGQDSSMNEDEFRNQFMASIPQTTRTSVTSRRIVKMIDSEGNVTEKVLGEGEDTKFDIDELRKHFTTTEQKSTSSRKIIKTVDGEGNVTEQIITEGDGGNEDECSTHILSSIPVAVKRTSVKTTRKIIRRTDEHGNVTEEVIDEPITEASKWEHIPVESDISNMTCTTVKRVVDTSGNIVDEQISVSQPDDISTKFESMRNTDLERSLPTAVKRTSVKTTKSITKRFDDQGNVIEEIISEDANPIIESELWKRASVEIPSNLQVTSSNTSVTTIKRTVDEHGNVVNEEVSTIDSKDPQSQLGVPEHEFEQKYMKKESGGKVENQENGKLIFKLHNATNLENKEWIGKSDPYAVVTLGQTVCKTETIANNLNPEFEQEMIFQINKSSPSALNIELFDENITRDGCLGNTAVEILPIKTRGKLVKQTKDLSNSKTGKINYSIEFIPEVNDIFCDANIECSLEGARKLKPVNKTEKDTGNKSELLMRMSDLGIENIELVSDDEDNNEDVLLKDVIDLQASTKKKISGLMKTIQNVELDTSEDRPQVYSRKVVKRIDSEGNVTEEIMEGDGLDSSATQFGIENQSITSRKVSQTFSRKTVKILDNEGNVIEEREMDTTGDGTDFDLGMLRNTSVQSTVRKVLMDQQGNVINETVENINVDDPEAYAQSFQRSLVTSPETYEIRKQFSSESDKSPTMDDIVYSEYPHLTTPMDQTFDALSSTFAASSHSVRYFHSSSEPFQNITSLRAHFVQAFDEDVPDVKSTEYDPAVKDVKFDDSFSSYSGNSNYNINSSVSHSTQLFSSTHSFSGSEFSSNKSTALEATEKLAVSGDKNTNIYMLASEEPSLEELSESSVTTWMEPIISGNCLSEKEFWKSPDNLPKNSTSGTEASQTYAFFSSSSHSSSPDQCLISGSHSLRSPVSMLKANSPVLFQSLPSSPKKKESVKKVITSELFSSDKDISRSLELVYTEPNDDPKEKLSSIYKSVAPIKGNLVERKPSFTKIKRPSLEYEVMSGSPSPEWRMAEGKSVVFSPCDSNKDYSFQTKTIQISPTSPQECQISKDICSSDPPCYQLFDPKSQSSVRSPERKFQYVQGNGGIMGTALPID